MPDQIVIHAGCAWRSSINQMLICICVSSQSSTHASVIAPWAPGQTGPQLVTDLARYGGNMCQVLLSGPPRCAKVLPILAHCKVPGFCQLSAPRARAGLFHPAWASHHSPQS